MPSRSCACHHIFPRTKAAHDNKKSWAERQAVGFEEWLNFTLVGAEELRHSAGRDDEDMEKRADSVREERGPSSGLSTPLKAMVAVVRAELLLYLSFKAVGARVLTPPLPPPRPKQKQKNGNFFLLSFSPVFFV